jgi:hypothetical protein
MTFDWQMEHVATEFRMRRLDWNRSAGLVLEVRIDKSGVLAVLARLAHSQFYRLIPGTARLRLQCRYGRITSSEWNAPKRTI